jgi:hypothetical protein
MSEYVDFGAPSAFGAHHFVVEIPHAAKDAIQIHEDFGFGGDESRRETSECRITLARELWSRIRDEARRDFNLRLKEKQLKSGSWIPGRVKLDRFLGRELCVLAWAAEHASAEECAIICRKWLALRPEERWWLYAKTAAEAGMAEHTDRGWRKALYCALSDGTSMPVHQKVTPRRKGSPASEPQDMDLFKLLNP